MEQRFSSPSPDSAGVADAGREPLRPVALPSSLPRRAAAHLGELVIAPLGAAFAWPCGRMPSGISSLSSARDWAEVPPGQEPAPVRLPPQDFAGVPRSGCCPRGANLDVNEREVSGLDDLRDGVFKVGIRVGERGEHVTQVGVTNQGLPRRVGKGRPWLVEAEGRLQIPIPHRTADVLDWAFDALGAAAGIVAFRVMQGSFAFRREARRRDAKAALEQV